MSALRPPNPGDDRHAVKNISYAVSRMSSRSMPRSSPKGHTKSASRASWWSGLEATWGEDVDSQSEWRPMAEGSDDESARNWIGGDAR